MAKKKVTGLGDVVKVVTDTLGIEQCDGCVERQNNLNMALPFNKKTQLELTTNEKEWLKRVGKNVIESSVDQEYIFQLYNRVTGSNIIQCDCPSIIEKMKQELIKINEQDDK